jgi:hypothetical protein
LGRVVCPIVYVPTPIPTNRPRCWSMTALPAYP